ncbi:dodecin family protein, partial [Marivita sp.]|uniref:dodecin family protein n=1 Tax=Marivita sp. TaxID=2003365 RepID=UPI0025C28081
ETSFAPGRDIQRSGGAGAETKPEGENKMSMLKVIEVLAESDKGFEDAAQKAVTQASQSVRNVKSVYIKDMNAAVENGQITSYRVNAKISFLLDDQDAG